jgi:hypothetical protein
MIYLQLIFLLINCADAWTTWQGIRFGAREAWLPRFLFKYTGVYWGLVVLKVGIVAVVWYFADDLGFKFIAVADAGYAALIVWNYSQLLKQKETNK